MKFDFKCCYCETETVVDIEEYSETDIICYKCKKEQVIIYSEDCVEDDDGYLECWDSYWVEEKEGESNG